MKNLNSPEQVNLDNIINMDEFDMEDQMYVEFLEKQLAQSIVEMEKKNEAISSFIELLSYIKENIGNTADYPIQITDDYTNSVFSERLETCMSKVLEVESKNSEHYELDPIF
jgi:hypothetical protein